MTADVDAVVANSVLQTNFRGRAVPELHLQQVRSCLDWRTLDVSFGDCPDWNEHDLMDADVGAADHQTNRLYSVRHHYPGFHGLKLGGPLWNSKHRHPGESGVGSSLTAEYLAGLPVHDAIHDL